MSLKRSRTITSCLNEIEDKDIVSDSHTNLSCIDLATDLLLELSMDNEFDKRRRKSSTDLSSIE
jgi:hypothetical protein